VSNERDLVDLREAIFTKCPHVGSRYLFWDVRMDESGKQNGWGCDLSLFGNPATAP